MLRTSGSGGFDTAKICFAENLQLFGNVTAQPEKFNLYTGLTQMAVALEQMQGELNALRQEIAILRQRRP